MKMNAYEFIVPFVRPWDHASLLGMARDMRANEALKGTRIRVLTVWLSAYEAVKADLQEGEEVVFLPAELEKAALTEEDRRRLCLLERDMQAACGTPLKMMLEAERFRPRNGEEAEAFMWKHFAVVDKWIPERAIMIGGQVDHLFNWLACDLTRFRGGVHFGTTMMGRPSGWTAVLRGPRDMWLCREPAEGDLKEAASQREQITTGVQPTYMKQSPRQTSLVRFAKRRLDFIREMRAGNYLVGPEFLLPQLPQLCHKVKWHFQKMRIPFCSLDAIKERRYVYLALHFEPEASTLAFSPLFKNQLHWVDCVAKSLPADTLLVVKVNPKMWGKRPFSFYRHILQCPSTCLIEPTTPSVELMRHARAVLTIAGTVAIEALLTGKPVALFGRPPFSEPLTSIPRIETLHEVPTVLRSLLDDSREPPREEQVDHEFGRLVANMIGEKLLETKPTGDWRIPYAFPYSPRLAAYAIEALMNEQESDE